MQAGLVSRVANEADARAPLYRLTRKGETVYAQIIAAWRARSAQLAEGIDEPALGAAAKPQRARSGSRR
jgi:DNA-binding MarR family transcriptional regulator